VTFVTLIIPTQHHLIPNGWFITSSHFISFFKQKLFSKNKKWWKCETISFSLPTSFIDIFPQDVIKTFYVLFAVVFVNWYWKEKYPTQYTLLIIFDTSLKERNEKIKQWMKSSSSIPIFPFFPCDSFQCYFYPSDIRTNPFNLLSFQSCFVVQERWPFFS